MRQWAELREHSFPQVQSVRTVLEHRDSYGAPNVAFSDHFALHWGGDVSIENSLLDDILESLERSWQYQIETLSFPAPVGTEQYYFNVYLGDTGSGTPPDYGVSGYYYTDPDGFPMVVLGGYVVENFASGKTTVPHEFFHAVQHSSGSYRDGGNAAWYWEATAVWMENEVYPLEEEYATFLFGFAFYPHYALDFFDYFETGETQEYYQYGAFIFPKFLSEEYISPAVIRDSWVDSTEQSPLGWLREHLEGEGENFTEVLSDFSARNVHWDYPDRDWYYLYLDYYEDLFAQDDHRIATPIHPAGTAQWMDGPAEFRPARYGYNHLQMRNPQMETAHVYFSGNSVGDYFGTVEWAVRLVVQRGDDFFYHSVDIVDGQGEAIISDLLSTDVVTISALALSEDEHPNEVFSYRYAVLSQPFDDTEEEDPKNSCATVDPRGLLGWLEVLAFLLLLLVIERFRIRVRRLLH